MINPFALNLLPNKNMELNIGFLTQWETTTSNETITLPIRSLTGFTFNFIANWGDGYSSTITSHDDPNRIHQYAIAGIYNIEIIGDCPYFSFMGVGDILKIKKILYWGGSSKFNGFESMVSAFKGCSNLTSIGEYDYVSSAFRKVYDFDSCFYGCESITHIPPKLFYNINLDATYSSFQSCFRGCDNLREIPEDLFRYATNAGDFTSCFYGVNNQYFKSIPENLFKYNTEVLSFAKCFRKPSIESIPENLFKYNTKVTTFEECFGDLQWFFSYIKSIPENLFKYNTEVTSFKGCFAGCRFLESIPINLFRFNLKAVNFSWCFAACDLLTMNDSLFYNNGEQITRFVNKSVNFTSFFQQEGSFLGVQGIAPDLWNCNFGTGTPIKTDCFEGNSISRLSNYASIPADWK